ncbi:unnamed protein product [Sphagnum compactum]
MVVTLQGAIIRHVNMVLEVQNARGMLDNVGIQDSGVVAKCHNVLIGRVQPHSPMGGQAPDMALDNEIKVDAQLKVFAKSRMQQRASKRAIEFEAQERKEKGLPGHKVQVTRHGKIDGACEGKDAWDGAIRSLAPWTLNMAVVKVTEQDPVDMARLRLHLDGKFEYVGGELSAAGFRDCVRRYMKGEKARLKRRYAQKGAKACPLGVDREQWDKLVIYWQQRDTKTKSEHMVDARGAVAKKFEQRRSPSISEMAAVGLDSSGTPGYPASGSPNWFSRITAIEKKLPEMSGQVSQVLEGMDKLNAKVEDFMQQLLACREDGVNVRNPKTVAATVNIEEVDVPVRTKSPEILGVAKSLHEVLHSDLDGRGSGTTVVDNATQLAPKAHHMFTGIGVGQQVDGVVPSHVPNTVLVGEDIPNYVLIGEDMGQNPNMLRKDIQVGVACKGGDYVDESNPKRPPSKARSKCPT